MRHGGFPRAILCAFTLLAACGERPPSPVGPYLAELRERLERLRPEVEQEIGRRFRDVEIVVLPRERIAESRISGVREALAQIENGPRGDDLETEAKAAAESGAEWALASVDEQGRIVFPDPEGKEGLGRLLLLSLLPGSEFEQDPRALDLILLHELVHVHQHRHRRIHPGKGLDREHRVEEGGPAAAERLGDLDAHDAELRQLVDELARNGRALVHVPDVGPDLAVCKCEHAVAEEKLVVVQGGERGG